MKETSQIPSSTSLILPAFDRPALWRDILPAVNAIRNAGTTSLEGISEALNKQGIRTARGKRWHVSSVANLLAGAKALAEAPR